MAKNSGCFKIVEYFIEIEIPSLFNEINSKSDIKEIKELVLTYFNSDFCIVHGDVVEDDVVVIKTNEGELGVFVVKDGAAYYLDGQKIRSIRLPVFKRYLARAKYFLVRRKWQQRSQ